MGTLPSSTGIRRGGPVRFWTIDTNHKHNHPPRRTRKLALPNQQPQPPVPLIDTRYSQSTIPSPT